MYESSYPAYQKIKDTQSKHFKGNDNVSMVVEPVQHSDAETVEIKLKYGISNLNTLA